jgi:TonB family protein
MINSIIMHHFFRIFAFMLVSVLAHMTALYSGDNNSTVSLSVANVVQPSITAQLYVAKNNNQNNDNREIARKSKVVPKQNNSIVPDESSHSSNSQYRTLVLSRVRGQMSQHFYYPAMARRQGWQGKVLLDFLLAENGHIDDVRVKLSSGYKILDHAAIDALSKVVLADVSNQELHIAMLAGRLSLPVVFRLIN